jgi:hypothetical protein
VGIAQSNLLAGYPKNHFRFLFYKTTKSDLQPTQSPNQWVFGEGYFTRGDKAGWRAKLFVLTPIFQVKNEHGYNSFLSI